MSLIDVAGMALHNLWSRKVRTTLNILGVVLACVVLAMTFAGTKGVSKGFQQLIRESEDVRKFVIRRSWTPDVEVPDEVTRVAGEMSEKRRARLQRRLRNKWLNDNADQVLMAEEELTQLRDLDHMRDVIPESRLDCTMAIGDVSEAATITGISADSKTAARVLAGQQLDPHDHRGILLGEFGAYRLGYASDDELTELVGKEIEISIRIGGQRIAQFLQLMDSGLASLSGEVETLAAIKRLIEGIDSTDLSDRQKELIRNAFSTSQTTPTEPLFLKEKFTVRGVVRDQDAEDARSFLRVIYMDTSSDIFMTPQRASQIQMGMEGFDSFWAATGVVDDIEHLGPLIEEVKALGFNVYSAKWIVDQIDVEIDKARLAISVLCLLILAISAIGISNTMIVSVLERTSEFGILKAIGARDRNILQLMLMEGALTGLLGAIVAIVISFSLAQLVAMGVRRYVSGRIGERFDASVFAFSAADLSTVLAVAVVVCTLAAIFPAYRAARLDPVVAMRKN